MLHSLQSLAIKGFLMIGLGILILDGPFTDKALAADDPAIDLQDRHAVEFSLLDNPDVHRPWLRQQFEALDPQKNPVAWVRSCWALISIDDDADKDLVRGKLPECIELAQKQNLILEWADLRFIFENIHREKEELENFSKKILQLIAEIREKKDPDALAFVLAKFGMALLEQRIVDTSLPYVIESNQLVESGASRSILAYEHTKMTLSTSTDYRGLVNESSAVDSKLILWLKEIGARKSLGYATYNRGFSRLFSDPADEAGATADFLEAIKLAKLVGDDTTRGNALYGLSLQNGRADRFVEARKQLNEALEIFTKLGNSHWVITCKILLVEYLQHTKEFQESLTLVEEVDKAISEPKSERKIFLLWLRYKAYLGLNDLPKAIKNLEKYQIETVERIRATGKEEYNKAAASLGLQIEQEKTKTLAKENQLQSQQLKEAERFRVFVIVLGFLSMSTLGLLVFALRQIKRIHLSKQKIQMILDNIDEGLLTVDKAQKIGFDFSKHLEKIVKPSTSFPGQDFVQNIFDSSLLPSEQKDIIRQVLSASFAEDAIVWDMNAANLPQEVQGGSRGERTLAIRWIPIFNKSNIMETLLVSLNDVTQARALEKALGEQEKRLRSLPDTLRELLQVNPVLIDRALSQTEAVLVQCEQQQSSQEIIRNLHTQKGVARTLGLRSLSQDLHELESSFMLSPLDSSPDPEKRKILVTARDRVREYQSFALILHQNLQKSEERDSWLQAAVNPHLHAWLKQMEEAGLPFKEIRIIDGFLHWTADEMNLVRDICLHAINNCLDHGFVFPKQRGAPIERPIIEVIAQEHEGSLCLEIRDNGVGLDWGRLKILAEGRGFVPGANESISDILFQDGITTAERVSMTSGRGVGLASVKSSILKRGGTVTIQNNDRGHGTLLLAKIPMNRELVPVAS